MYMTARMLHAQPGHGFDVLASALEIVEQLNARYGSELAVMTQIGGDPHVVGVSGGWATLGAYQDFVDQMMADEELMAKGLASLKLTTSVEDLIARALSAPGERAAFSSVAMAHLHLPRIAEAMPFVLEVAEMAEAKLGMKVGVVHAMTGARSQVAWISRHASLDAMTAASEQLDADPEFLELYKRGEGLIVDGSLEQIIWRIHS